MEKITAFKAIDGSLHERECDAYSRNLKLTIDRITHSGNLYKDAPDKQRVWDHAVRCFGVYFEDIVREVNKLGPRPLPEPPHKEGA